MTPRTSGRAPLRRAVEITLAAAFLGFVGWSLAGRWSEVRDVIGDLSVAAVALATVAAMAASWCSFLAWRAVLADFGAEVPVAGATRIFFVGQLAKYLPGKVWPILTQARLGRAYQVPGRSSAAAALLVMLISLGTGLLLTATALPVLGDRALDRYWWVLLALPLAAVLLWPPLLNRGLARLMRLARREPMPRPLSLRGVGAAVGWSVATWLGYGLHLWLLLLDLGVSGPDLLIRSIGAFAGSWSVGFLLAVAPAGVGPREVALPLLLGATVAQPVALVAAVVSRLLIAVVDLAFPAVAALAGRSRRRAVTGAKPAPVVAPEWAAPGVAPEWAAPVVAPEWAAPVVAPERAASLPEPDPGGAGRLG